jgi:transcriptional regulator with XRE-family HTH domain
MTGGDVDNSLAMGKFGDTVRRLRKAARLSQDELAQAAKVSRATIQIVEKSEEPQMYGRNYRQLAAALGKTPDELDAEWREAGTRSLQLPAEVAGLIEQHAAAEKMEPAEWLRAMVNQMAPAFQGKTGVNPRPTRKAATGPAVKGRAETSPKQG